MHEKMHFLGSPQITNKGVQFNSNKPAVAKDFGINAANQRARVFVIDFSYIA